MNALRGLFFDKGKNSLSLGRIAFWLTFLPALWVWLVRDTDVHAGHLTLLTVLLAYALGDKATRAYAAASTVRATGKRPSGSCEFSADPADVLDAMRPDDDDPEGGA